ncbi:MAG: hypothetical protein Q7S44_02265 [bacterium]|nr:hypothetical protein [bacterium]
MRWSLPLFLGLTILAFIFLLKFPTSAQAYVDPGTGLEPPCSSTSQSCAFSNGQFTYADGSGALSCSQERNPAGECVATGTCGSCYGTCSTTRDIPYCEGESLYKTSQCAQDFGAAGSTTQEDRDFVEDCTTHGQRAYPGDQSLWSDWHCNNSEGQAACRRKYDTTYSLSPNNPPLLGEPETFTVSGTKSCGATNFIPKNLGGPEGTTNSDGFVDTTKYKQYYEKICYFKYNNCGGAGELPCIWSVECVPTTLSENQGYQYGFTFQSFPTLVPDRFGNDCTNKISYPVASRYCTLAPEKPINDPNGDFKEKIVGKTTDDDQGITKVMGKALLPNQINDELENIATGTPNIGVQTGFFADFLKLICDAQSLVQNIPIIGSLLDNRWFCISQVNLAQQRTERFTQRSKTLALTEYPSELTPTPVLKSCYLEDLEKRQTIGNKDLNTLDTSLATNSGVYSLGLPDFPAKSSITYGQVGGVTSSDLILDNAGSNISLQTKTFAEDNRAPDINCRQEMYYQSNYPNLATGQYQPLYIPITGTKPCIPSPAP